MVPGLAAHISAPNRCTLAISHKTPSEEFQTIVPRTMRKVHIPLKSHPFYMSPPTLGWHLAILPPTRTCEPQSKDVKPRNRAIGILDDTDEAPTCNHHFLSPCLPSILKQRLSTQRRHKHTIPRELDPDEQAQQRITELQPTIKSNTPKFHTWPKLKLAPR